MKAKRAGGHRDDVCKHKPSTGRQHGFRTPVWEAPVTKGCLSAKGEQLFTLQLHCLRITARRERIHHVEMKLRKEELLQGGSSKDTAEPLLTAMLLRSPKQS